MRETTSKTVENEDVIGFAELSGDRNPIHLSEHFARNELDPIRGTTRGWI